MPSTWPSLSSPVLISCMAPFILQSEVLAVCKDTNRHSLFGYDQGVTGGLLEMPSFTKHFEAIDQTQAHLDTFPPDVRQSEKSRRATYQGITVASYNLGCFLGAIFTIFIGDRLGRKKTIFFGSIIMIIGAILQCTSFELPQFIVGRIVTGWGNGMNTSTVPMWQSETASAHHRGKLVMIEGMLVTGGITLSYWIDYGKSFQCATFLNLY